MSHFVTFRLVRRLQRSLRRRRQRLPSLQAAITLPLSLLFLSMVVVQALTQHHTVEGLIRDESTLLLRQLTGGARVRLDQFLAPPVQAQRTLRDAITRYRLYASADIEAVQRHISGLYHELYLNDTQIGVLSFGSEREDYVGLRRQGHGSQFHLMRKDVRVSDRLRIFDAEDARQELASFPAYRPTQRPWYQPSASTRRELWTEVYVNQDELSQLTLSNTAPVEQNGRLLGVVAADVTLDGLNRFLATESQRIGGLVYVVDADNQLVATSVAAPVVLRSTAAQAGDAPPQARRLQALAYPDAVVRASARFLPAGTDTPSGDSADFSFDLGREPYVGRIERYQSGNGIDWRIVAVLPQAHMLGHVRKVHLAVLFGTCLLGLMGLYLVIVAIGGVTQPMAQIAMAAGSGSLAHIGTLDPRRARVREAAALMQALTHMAQELRSSFRRLRDSAYLDELTGLLSRRGLADAISWTDPRPCMVCMLAIDDLETVHEVFGHATGEQVIRELADRVKRLQPPPLAAARMAGGELVLVFRDSRHASSQQRHATTVLHLLDLPFRTEGDSLPLRGTLGVAAGEMCHHSLPDWLRRAASALAHGRAQGLAGYVLFNEQILADAIHRATVLRELERAIQRGELFAMYQPIIDIQSGALVGVEALVRWQHPERGLVAPGEFLPYAERTDLVVRIGELMLAHACRDAIDIRHRMGHWIDVHVNISPRQLFESGFVEGVRQRLKAHAMPARHLVLELTESTFISKDSSLSKPVFAALQALGVQLAIDDFGTGYSSLSYLERLPIDGVKIDKSFVDKLLDMPATGEALVGAIVSVSRALNLDTVAEGVESAEQLQILHRLGCHRAQGYLLGRPQGLALLDIAPRAVGQLAT